ncbi:hypothetical protein DQD36_20295 [Salmonella enterica subsp. enterica serovar Chester]|nr:hypothetical protein [Salmonella enterica subsp. enterica serovar Chester]EBW7376629.1 hypothetical protein [Salmonella enterica subsp. enterica serovar Chester]EDV1697413.1 hypothetical protein [Salmonella enterica subsp. enterica]EEL6718456.1 hypothetical protein [Salmonella enterica subsp. enterica serovar Chester]HCB5264054.1 hypothetical protein [Salmonella enterica subsp. enterica serovar Oranienburg]
MKKTLIALAASAVVSGSAMAADWAQNGHGGSVELGGTLNPVEKTTPWEVKVGDAATSLNAQILKGQKVVNFAVNKAIPVLGIRTQTAEAFQGQAGISPQIDYHGVVDFSQNEWGSAPVTLEVFDNSSNKIGSLQTTLTTAAVYSWKNGAKLQYGGMAAKGSGDGFFGGLGNFSSALGYSDAVANLNGLSNEFLEKYTKQGAEKELGSTIDFSDVNDTYSAAYGSGIKQGRFIKITLDKAADADEIDWKASLPVTVSYQ